MIVYSPYGDTFLTTLIQSPDVDIFLFIYHRHVDVCPWTTVKLGRFCLSQFNQTGPFVFIPIQPNWVGLAGMVGEWREDRVGEGGIEEGYLMAVYQNIH